MVPLESTNYQMSNILHLTCPFFSVRALCQLPNAMPTATQLEVDATYHYILKSSGSVSHPPFQQQPQSLLIHFFPYLSKENDCCQPCQEEGIQPHFFA